MDEDPVLAQRALSAGAVGFVVKDRADTELPEAVRAAARREEDISSRVAARPRALQRSLTEDKLSAREIEVPWLIALGRASAEIARKLHISHCIGGDSPAGDSPVGGDSPWPHPPEARAQQNRSYARDPCP
jgi:DNA-binding NarL/FixJ family response regulator